MESREQGAGSREAQKLLDAFPNYTGVIPTCERLIIGKSYNLKLGEDEKRRMCIEIVGVLEHSHGKYLQIYGYWIHDMFGELDTVKFHVDDAFLTGSTITLTGNSILK